MRFSLKMFQLSQAVHRLFSIKDWEPLLLFENGTVSWLSSAKENPHGEPLASAIQWAEVAELNNQLHLVIVMDKKVVVHTFKQDGTEPEITQLDLQKSK